MMIWELVSAAVGAATSAFQSSSQNRAVEQSQAAAVDATNTQNQQLASQASGEQLKHSRETARVLGRLRVAGTEAGTADEALLPIATQAAINNSENASTIGGNTTRAVASNNSSLEAQLLSLAAGKRNTGLAILNGGLQGLQLGLSLQGAFSDAASGSVDALTGNTLDPSLQPLTGTLERGQVIGDLASM